ncbi:proton-conducting transporter membrane subunit [Planctobacterium marinum]|uniref:Cation:proton antiporter n=1 Tax=Planctobacterium marinum TaxID=1631968 RepID=A0AA48KTD1_9ALTE|nr:cation:proton antiporter [Planctobacterium marinum]
MSTTNLLLTTFALPLILIALILLFRKQPNLREAASIGVGILVFVCNLMLLQHWLTTEEISFTLFTLFPGVTIAFDIEPLGMIFALVASALWPVTTLYALGYMRAHHEPRQTQFYCFFALSIFSVMGIAFAGNLMTLFVFYELLTLATFPLVAHAGTKKAKRGARTYLGILLFSSILFFLLAVISTWHFTGTMDFKLGGILDGVSDGVVSVLLILFVFGVGKAAIMPLHGWLPAAMVAPTPVSALLHAVAVVKAGVFTILKVMVYVFGIERLATIPSGTFLLYLAGFSILFASLVAIRKRNLKARLAWSTVSQLGYITMGALLASPLGVVGSAMHITMHAFSKITLFFCAGAIIVAAHKTEIPQMRGLGKQMPITMLAFGIASLGIIGLPPAGGTWSKWMLLMGTAETEHWILMLILMVSSLLSIGYLLPVTLRAFFPGPEGPAEPVHANGRFDLAPTASLIAIVITTFACLALFFYADAIYQFAMRVV